MSSILLQSNVINVRKNKSIYFFALSNHKLCIKIFIVRQNVVVIKRLMGADWRKKILILKSCWLMMIYHKLVAQWLREWAFMQLVAYQLK